MDLKIDKVLDELNLKARKLTHKFNNSVMDLEIIIEEIEKINDNKRCEIEKTKGIIKKELEEFKTEKTEESEWILKFSTLKFRLFKDLSDYGEKRKAREMTRKTMEEIDIFGTKIKNIRELIIDTIEHDYDKLIGDLKMERGLGIEKIINRNKTREIKNMKNNT